MRCGTLVLLAALFIPACNKDKKKVFVRVENKSSEDVDLSVIYVSRSARVEDNYLDPPISASLAAGELMDVFIQTTNNPVRGGDDSFFEEAWFEKQNYEDFTICFAKDPYHYYIYEKNTDCEVGTLSTDTPPYPRPEEN